MSSSTPPDDGQQPLPSPASTGSFNPRTTQDIDNEFNTQLLKLVAALEGAQATVHGAYQPIIKAATFLELKNAIICAMGEESASLLSNDFLINPKFTETAAINDWASNMARRVLDLDVPQQQKESLAKICFHRECLRYTHEKRLRSLSGESEESIQESLREMQKILAKEWKGIFDKRFAKGIAEAFEEILNEVGEMASSHEDSSE